MFLIHGNPVLDGAILLAANSESTANRLTIVVGVVGVVIGWVLGVAQKSFEIKKLKAESIKLAGEHLSKVQAARDQFNEAAARCTKDATTLLRAIQQSDPKEQLDEKREELCSTFIEVVIPRYLSHMEWEHLDNRSDPEAIKSLVDEELTKELSRFEKWLTTINAPKLLSFLDRTEAKISKRKIRPFLKLARDVPAAEHSVYRARIDKAIDSIAKG